MMKLPKKITNIILLSILIISLSYILIKNYNESRNQDDLFREHKFKFIASILKSKPIKSHYQNVETGPQESFFIDCKLKYLILKNSSELIDSEQLIEFEKDSIKKIVKRKQVYKIGVNRNKTFIPWNSNTADTIYIRDYKNKILKVFTKNKLVKTTNREDPNKDDELIYRVKKQTESDFDCR